MPAITALTINDGALTPVAHTFNPVTTNGSSAEFAERSASVPNGYFKLTHEVRRPASAAAAHRVIMGFNMPTITSVSGVPTVVRNSSAKVEFNLSSLSSEQERKDLLAYITNVLSNAAVKTTVQNIEPFW